MKTHLFFSLFSSSVLLTAFTACVVPVNSSFESAATVPKGHTELRGNFSHYFASAKEDGDRETEAVNTNLGVGVGVPVAQNADVRFRYEMLIPKKYDGERPELTHYFSLAPKYSFARQKVAFKLPLSLYYVEDETEWLISPQLLFSPVRQTNFDLTVSGKLDIFLGKDAEFSDSFVGFTLGAGVGKDVEKGAFRPEIGLMFALDEDDDGTTSLWTVGLAYCYRFAGKRAANR